MEEARAQSPLPWKVQTCHSGENCWCRLVVSAAVSEDHPDYVVISSGAVSKDDAEFIVAAANALAGCRNAVHMGEHACKDRRQCWEPCGQLGHSEEHARLAPPLSQGLT